MSWFDTQGKQRTGVARRTMAVAAGLALAGTVVAGCGDDDDGAAVDSVDTEVTEADETTETTEADDTTETTEAEEMTETEESAQEQVSVDIVSIEDAFEPSTATVAAGGEVTWVNTDDIAHTATAEDGTWDSGNLEPGAEFTFAPEEPGTYPYFCSIHPSMEGELVVE